MAINKKLIHFKTKQNFDNKVANNEILDTSIVFIQDSKEIHTHGTTYKSVNWSVLEPPKGVFIYDINGKYILPSEWDTNRNEEAVGVAILTDNCKFVVAKEDAKSSYVSYGGYGTDILTLTNYANATSAATDFDGVNNTSKIITALGSSNTAGYCAEYIFPNEKTGYLGAAGEWKLAHSYKSELNSALKLIGGISMTEGEYWTSTKHSSNDVWIQNFGNGGSLGSLDKGSYRYVRAFLAI